MTDSHAFVVAGGRRLEYRWIGPRGDEAPTLVFLHEGLGSASLWRDFPDRLAAATGCGALVYSRAGYGRSDPIDLPRPVAFMHHEAAVLAEVLERTCVVDPVLVGHSDGASIAIIYAGSDAGPRPRALLLEAPHVFTEPHGLAGIAAIRETYATTGLRERLARHHRHVDVAFRGWNDVWLDPDFRAWNIEAYLPRIAAPVLVVQGEDDEYGTWAQVDAIRAGTGGRVEVLAVPACGHAPHREHPDVVLAAMARFVRALAPPPP